MKSDVAVIYLARSADGAESFRRFAESYREYPAQIPHELVVIYKGFPSRGGAETAGQEFAGLSHISIELDDTGFDIGSYWKAAQRIAHRQVVFLNTHTTVNAGGWLKHLYRHAAEERCGIAGTMGSYESLQSTVPFLEAVITASLTATGEKAKQLARYFDFLLPRFRPDWYGPQPERTGARALLDPLWRLLFSRADSKALPVLGGKRGSALIWPGAPELDVSAFPPFPNPHVRSNGFMVRRDRFLALDERQFQSKADANLFESGRNSITAQFRRAGLAAIVVGGDGAAYPVEDWPSSRTFRLDRQDNLLIADNHTRAFNGMSDAAKAAHVLMTWGDYASDLPDVPRLGFRFDRGSLASAPAREHANAASAFGNSVMTGSRGPVPGQSGDR
jgi:hypothetical protein